MNFGISSIMHIAANNTYQAMKKKHGGKRPGSGRPKLKKKDKKEPTKTMRVPISLVNVIKEIIIKHKGNR